jgi:peptidoglycan/xylan/chitin deacetylase (PgdA/CDA1 family)
MRWAIESFERTCGQRCVGWYCRYGASVNTRELLVEEGGFLYDSDTYNDELPYWKTVKGRPHLVVPYSLTNNDGKYVAGTSTGEQWFSFVKDAFDMLLREGARHPKMMSIGLHMRLTGHPARAAGLERLLDYVGTQTGVWITRRIDIARHWIATHPYPGHGLNEEPARSAGRAGWRGGSRS